MLLWERMEPWAASSDGRAPMFSEHSLCTDGDRHAMDLSMRHSAGLERRDVRHGAAQLVRLSLRVRHRAPPLAQMPAYSAIDR
mmetsp:Transcript_6106/g.17069  ORF Transcript_6106/g.17069 Transcript_6106/m.17069 type:complete len:83 (+) Transcript_6106:165-413(+)